MTHWKNCSKVFHRRAHEYDGWFDDSLLFRIETAAILALPVPLNGPMLEIGVGPGRFSQALGAEFGIDPALAPLVLARERGIKVCRAIGEQLPFQTDSFSTVTLLFTLCFLQNPDQVLAEVHRVLGSRGTLILGFVPAGGVWGKHLQAKKEAGHPFYEHARLQSPNAVTTLLTRHGFLVHTAMSTLFQPPEAVSCLEEPRQTMDDRAGFVVLAASPHLTD